MGELVVALVYCVADGVYNGAGEGAYRKDYPARVPKRKYEAE